MLELTTITGARMLCDAKNITAVMGMGDRIRVYFGLQGWAVEVVDDPDRVLDACRRALRDERAAQFALAIVTSNLALRMPSCRVWQEAQSLADAEPKNRDEAPT